MVEKLVSEGLIQRKKLKIQIKLDILIIDSLMALKYQLA